MYDKREILVLILRASSEGGNANKAVASDIISVYVCLFVILHYLSSRSSRLPPPPMAAYRQLMHRDCGRSC